MSDLTPCLTEYGLPRYPNRSAAEAAIPEGWRNRPVLFRCGSGHHHVGHWPRTSPHPIPLPQNATGSREVAPGSIGSPRPASSDSGLPVASQGRTGRQEDQ